MIELRNIHKYFGKVKALQGVTLKVASGSIHGVVGENGAGKTTLMKVLTGYIHRSAGSITFNAKAVDIRTPRDAMSLGIGMLYQEPLDFLQLSVLDNFMTGMEHFSPQAMKKTLSALCKKFGFTLNPNSPLSRLTVGERQQLELMRLIHKGIRVLILDEPTTGISDEQQELLFSALTSLRDQGCAIILVSHKLSEVDTLCDEVSVLRQGMIAGHQTSPFDRDQLLQAMFDTLPKHRNSPEVSPGNKEILSFRNISSSVGRSGLKNITLTINEGEVVGLAGLDGSGQAAFLRLAGNLLTPEAGQLVRFGGNAPHTKGGHNNEIVFLPADRLNEGLIAGLSIREHLLLATETPLFIVPNTGMGKAKDAITKFNILGTPDSFADGLSGGNQQRLLLSLMPPDARLILMENPTRGLDLQSGAWTWQHLLSQLPADGALIFASPDLEEIMEYAGRVLVFFDGKIILDTATCNTSFDDVSRAITGQVRAIA